MAVASEADLQAAIGKAVIMHSELFAQLATGSNNFQSRDATLLAAIPADAAPGAQAGAAAIRAAVAAPFAGRALAHVVGPLLDAYIRTRDLQIRPDLGFWDALREDMALRGGGAKTVKNRAFVFDSWAAGGSNVGNGLPRRLTKDRWNYTIESGFAELKTAKCIVDANSGATRHEETFLVYGERAGKDALERNGSGAQQTLTCLSARTSAAWLDNPSFDNVAATTFAAVTDVIGWTMSAYASFETVSSDYYRDMPGATTNRCIRFLGNASIYQRFIDIPLRNWNPNVPLYAQIAFKRESSCDGTLTFTIGNVSTSVALSAQSGWTVLTFAITSDAWHKAWNKSVPSGTLTNALVKIELTSRTTGTLLVDDVIIGPYTRVDGAWLAMVGGSTPFLRDDVFTATDTTSETGLIQTWLARTYGEYLPHTSGSPTWTEPS